MDEKTRRRILDFAYGYSHRHTPGEVCPQVPDQYCLHPDQHLYVDLKQLQEFIKRI